MVEENKENNQQETAVPMQPAEILSSLKGFGDIKLNVKVLLGRIKMPIGQYLKITRGSIVELGTAKSAPLDVIVNEQKIAECDIVLTPESEKVGVEVTKLFKPKKF